MSITVKKDNRAIWYAMDGPIKVNDQITSLLRDQGFGRRYKKALMVLRIIRRAWERGEPIPPRLGRRAALYTARHLRQPPLVAETVASRDNTGIGARLGSPFPAVRHPNPMRAWK